MKMYVKGLFDDPTDGSNGGTDNGNADNGDNNGGAENNNPTEKLYTKAEMDAYTNAIVSRKKAEWKRDNETSIKDEAERLAAMTAQQRAEHDRDTWKQKYEEQLKINTRTTLTAEARKQLSDAGVLNVSDSLLDRLVGDDATTTKASIDEFIKAYNTAVQAGIKDKAKRPSPKAGTSSGVVTKESIMAIKDPIERQAMMRKHHKLFGF